MGSKAKKIKALKRKLKNRKEKLVRKNLRIAMLEAQAQAQPDEISSAETISAALTTAPTVSPFAPEVLPYMHPIEGVSFATAAAGVRYTGRTDVMLARLDPGTAIAGVFTSSKTRAAPVLWCEEALKAHEGLTFFDPAAILVNSGNANAFTGSAGMTAVETTASAVAQALGTDRKAVFPASTGVIGEPLPAERITAVIEDMASSLDPNGWEAAARAIMTTDTFPKLASVATKIDDVPVMISGFAKGSGMIAPDMATMLVYIFTDAHISADALQGVLDELNAETFNSITVDGDTSTSDTLLLAATGKSVHEYITDPHDPRLADFRAALQSAMRNLAHQVVKDGEGASKFVEITVNGAQNKAAAHNIAMSIANSPLVKTAFAGEDPNWGRVVMAVGKSGEAADRDRLSIWFGDILVAAHGQVAPDYNEADAAEYMRGAELQLTVDIGVSDGQATVWTCDLTNQYIAINADYRS